MSSVWQGTDAHATVAATAAADKLVGQRVLAMPIPGYGKHDGTVTDAVPGSGRCSVRWDDGSNGRYLWKQVREYLDYDYECLKCGDRAVTKDNEDHPMLLCDGPGPPK
jgi:hypothetical protein